MELGDQLPHVDDSPEDLGETSVSVDRVLTEDGVEKSVLSVNGEGRSSSIEGSWLMSFFFLLNAVRCQTLQVDSRVCGSTTVSSWSWSDCSFL